MTKRMWMTFAIGLGMVWSIASAYAAETPASQTPAASHPKDVKTATASHHRPHHRRTSTKPGTKPVTAGQKMPAGGAPVAK